jgi:MoaA/NifB/PqqE/SkfB family radical SAM enzyme
MPQTGVISPSSRCNNRCWMCGGLSSGKAKHHEASLAQILEDVSDMRRQGVETLVITGGEPTIYPGFKSLLDHACGLGFGHISLFTNGRTLTMQLLEYLLEVGVDCILVSLHAPNEALGDKISNSKGSFRQTLRGLERLNEIKSRRPFNLAISCVPCYLTEALVQDVASLALTYEIDDFFITYPIDGLSDSPIPRDKAPRLKPLSKSVSAALGLLTERGVRPHVSAIPPCCYPGYERCYFDAYPQAPRAMVGYHQKQDAIERIVYHDLSPEEVCAKVEECAGCVYDQVCFGVPRHYLDAYEKGEVAAVDIERAARSALLRRIQDANISNR